MIKGKISGFNMSYVKVKLIPPLDKEVGSKEINVSMKESTTVFDILNKLSLEYKVRLVIDNDLNPGYLVLLNDKDINVLEGLKTKVKNGDILTIIPVSHGG